MKMKRRRKMDRPRLGVLQVRAKFPPVFLIVARPGKPLKQCLTAGETALPFSLPVRSEAGCGLPSAPVFHVWDSVRLQREDSDRGIQTRMSGWKRASVVMGGSRDMTGISPL